MKNKLGQTKAWGSSLTAQGAQAQLIALTHNLLVGYERELEERHGVTNTADDQRRRQRGEAAGRTCAEIDLPLSFLVLASLRDRLAEAAAVPRLQAPYSGV